MRTCKLLVVLILLLSLTVPAFADEAAEDLTAKLEDLTGVTAQVAEEKYKEIKKGSNGNTVKAVQTKLIELGYLKDKADGSFGAKTQTAVELYETEQGLEVNGILSPLEIYYTLECAPLTRTEVVIAAAKAGDPESISAALNAMPIRVTGAKVLVQSKLNKETYPDMLVGVVENKTEKNITSYTIGFLAYDANGQAKQILTQYDDNGYYEIIGDASEISLPAGGSFGSSYGWRLDEDHGLVHIMACVQNATFEDGSTWDNPVYSIWKDTYAEQQINPENLNG